MLKIKYSLFESFFGKTMEKLREEGEIAKIINDIYLFHHLPELEINKIIRDVNVESFNKKDEIIKENTIGDKMYIVKSGEVKIYKGEQYIRTLSSGEFFGEAALITKENRSATAIAVTNVKCYVIGSHDFSKYIIHNQKLRDYLLKLMRRKHFNIKLTDLLSIIKCGTGTYGSVYLVKHKVTKELFAIKVISKKLMDTDEIHTSILNEKNFLSTIDHPFIVKIISGLKDDNMIYLLMENCSGMNMLDIISGTRIKLEMVKFYIASLLITLDYMHNKKIIHRDIKPENIMVNTDGYIQLIDFGTAKYLKDDRTNSFIGTPHYLSPEVILENGYSFYVDFWAMGVCLYQFLCGSMPFGDSDNDPIKIYQAIMKENISFPDFVKDSNYKDLVHKLLDRDMQKRYYKFETIKEHPFFSDINWHELSLFKIDPSYKPLPRFTEEFINNQPVIEFLDMVKDKIKNETDLIYTINEDNKKYQKFYDDF